MSTEANRRVLRSGDTPHILIWVRSPALASRTQALLADAGFATCWAASLPEAIAALDRCYPAAVVCTLNGCTPSLIDLETLFAYQALGHPGLIYPPTPAWALCAQPSDYAAQIEALDLPVSLVPASRGPQGVVDELVQAVALIATPLGTSRRIQIGFARYDEARRLARYLASRGYACRASGGPTETWHQLRQWPCDVLISDIFSSWRSGGSFWREVEENRSRLPVLLVGRDGAELSGLSPLALPRNLAGAFARPLPIATLEATLRRLLRLGRGVGVTEPASLMQV